MTNDTSLPGLPAIPDIAALAEFNPNGLAQFVEESANTARDWLAHAQYLMTTDELEEVNPDDILMAICHASDTLDQLELAKPALIGLVAGVGAAIETLTQQRDEATEAYEQLAEELEERVRQGVERGIGDALTQAFATDDDAEEAEIDMLARQMVLGDEEDVIDEATRVLARKLRKAKELAGEYRAHGLPEEEYTEDPDDEGGDIDDDLT